MHILLRVDDGSVRYDDEMIEAITTDDAAWSPEQPWRPAAERLSVRVRGGHAEFFRTPCLQGWSHGGRRVRYRATLMGEPTPGGRPMLGEVEIDVTVDLENPGPLAARVSEPSDNVGYAATEPTVGLDPHPDVPMVGLRAASGRMVGPIGPRCRRCGFASLMWDPICRSCLAPIRRRVERV